MIQGYMIAIVVSVCAVVASIYLAFSLRRLHRFVQLQQSNLDKQLKMVNSGVLGMGSRIIELEHKLASVRRTQQDVSESHIDFSYSQARKMLGQGLSQQAVVASTGLSASEIQLMNLVQTSTAQDKPVSGNRVVEALC